MILDGNTQKEMMEKIYNSTEYNELEMRLSHSNPQFAELEPNMKLLSVYLLFYGGDEVIDTIWTLFYNNRPPSFTEFLDSLGVTGKMTYAKWREALTDHFSPDSRSYELIFTGSIGSGKSFASRLAIIYNLLRILYLREPQLTLGLTPESLIVASLLTVTMEKANLAVYKPYIKLLEGCTLFEKVNKQGDITGYRGGPTIPFIDKGTYCEFPNNIILNTGSQVSHAISFDMVMAVLDEAEFRIGSAEKALDVYSELKNRIKSRFLASRYKLLCLVSSSKSSSGVIATYASTIDPGDVSTRKYAFPIWEIKLDDPYKNGYFYAMRGTSQHPSRVLIPVEYEAYERGDFETPVGCEVFKVPMEYEREFKLQVDKALRDIAGVMTAGEDHIFDTFDGMEVPEFLTPELNLQAVLGKGRPILEMIPEDVFVKVHDQRRFRRAGAAPRFCHVDLAESPGSEAGLSIVHKELGDDFQEIVVADLILSFSSPSRIDIEAIVQFLIDLVEKCGVYFWIITADQYQSSAMLQRYSVMKLARIVERLSVDKVTEPYFTLARAISNRQLKTGAAEKVKTQMSGVAVENGKLYSLERKDMADSLCGAVFNAFRTSQDIPTIRWSSLNETYKMSRSHDVQIFFKGMKVLEEA